MEQPPILVIENEADDPPGRLGTWLTEVGATLDVVRPYAGDAVPADLAQHSGLVVLGGVQSAYSDDGFGWRIELLRLLKHAVDTRVPTLGVCLGGQLLAVATGGTVRPGTEGLELGAALVARRDLSYDDPIFGDLPLTPDVLHFHLDEISTLPPGATLLASGPVYAHQAFRVGTRAWGTQFHVETEPETFLSWIEGNLDLIGRELPGVDLDALIERAMRVHPELAATWAHATHRFVDLTREERAA